MLPAIFNLHPLIFYTYLLNTSANENIANCLVRYRPIRAPGRWGTAAGISQKIFLNIKFLSL